MTRDWSDAVAKVQDEGMCRGCGSSQMLDPAHVIPRSRGGDMSADAVVPLCRSCHSAYDAGGLELLSALTRVEQVHAVELVGIAEAFRRTTRRAA